MVVDHDFRKRRPAIVPVEQLDFIPVEKVLLSNGIPVWLLRGGDQEVIRVEIVFDAGTIYHENPLVAGFTNLALKEGTKSYSSAQIAEWIDSHGATIHTETTADYARISLDCLTKHAIKLIPLLHEMLLMPTFPEKEIAIQTERARQDFLINLEKVKFLARRRFTQLVFGEEHFYNTTEDPENYDQINGEVLRGFFEQYYYGRPFRMIVAGNFPADFPEVLNKYFGVHQITSQTLVPCGTGEIKPVTGFHHVEKPDALQSAIHAGKPLFNRLHPDFVKMQVLTVLLGGYFGSRLMTNIREEKGYTYGIHASFVSARHEGVFSIVSQVGTSVTRQAIDEILREIQKLQHEPVSEEELQLVKNYLTGQLLRMADGPFAQSVLLRNAIEFNLEMEYYQDVLRQIKSINADEILQLAVTYLNPESLVWVIAGQKTNQ